MMLSNPTPNSNYLLDERIIFGWYPTPHSNGLFSNNILDLLKSGRDVFVNLTTFREKNSLYDYQPTVRVFRDNPVFIHYPIEDGGLPSDDVTFSHLINRLNLLLKENRKLYIHCRGGHGRSGLVAGCLLISMGYEANVVLKMLSTAHGTRQYLPDYPCPQTSAQVNYVLKYQHSSI